MKNTVFIPTFAKSTADIETAVSLGEPLEQEGYCSALMLVMKDGIKGVSDDRKEQYENLAALASSYGEKPIIVMLSVFPLEEIDFLNHREKTIEHIKAGIDFASGLPVGKEKILTFHINAWMPEKEFLAKPENEWFEKFDSIIAPTLKEISRYAAAENVGVKIETVPAPVFGDIGDEDTRTYNGAKLNELRNPFVFGSGWGFEKIRECGIGICLDICHNRTIYKTIQAGDPEKLLLPAIAEAFRGKSLMDDVYALAVSDIVHLAGGIGLYRKGKEVFKEGVPLGEGDIKELPEIIRYLNEKGIKFALEIRDRDFSERKETERSIEYLLATT